MVYGRSGKLEAIFITWKKADVVIRWLCDTKCPIRSRGKLGSLKLIG